jgi:hypothetical protein
VGFPKSNHDVWDLVIERATDPRDEKHLLGVDEAGEESRPISSSWATTLLKLVNHLRQYDHPRQEKITVRATDDPFFFLPLCIPIVRYAIRELETSCSSSLLGLFSRRAHRHSRIFLTSRFLCVLTPAARQAFADFVVTAGTAMSGGGRTESLLRKLADEFFQPSPATRLLTILERYPALARLLSELCMNWVAADRELFQRLRRDKQRLIKCFSNSSSFSAKSPFIKNAKFGMGDSHQNGRSVVVLSVSGGDDVVYKPRDCRGEFEWGRLLRRLKEDSLRPRHPKVVLGKGYGWMEFVKAERCRTSRGVEAFYRRAGTQLCVAALLRATDLHRGNLIAAGSHPVILDAETLWQVNEEDEVRPFGLARTGLLPGRDGAGNSNESAFESTGFDLADGQDKHRPSFHNRSLPASEFVGEIMEGFCCAGLKLLSLPTVRGLLKQLDGIRTHPWRMVFWSTSHYETLRLAAIEPIQLTSGNTRFQWLLEKCTREGIDKSVAFAEAQALARFDIPYFTATTKDARRKVSLLKVAQLLQLSSEIQRRLKPS